MSDPTLEPVPADDFAAAPAVDRAAVLAEVGRGLPCERQRLAEAHENQAYAELRQSAWEDERREAESDFDFAVRPKKRTGFLHQALGRLCSHTYNPGPHRSTGDAAADKVLQAAYAANHIDALMSEAERLATTNDVAAIQVRWVRGRRPGKDIDLQLWGAEEFAIFPADDDPREPAAVVTIDRADEVTRYRVWFADVVHTLRTAKAGGADARRTAGGVVALEEAGSPVPNPYGVLPFAFVPYRPQVRQFWTTSPGSFLRQTECTVNRQASELAEAIVKYSCPVAWFKNVGVEFNPELGPGRFLRLMRGGPAYSGDGYTDGGDPDAGYLQAELAIESIWADIRNTLDQAAEACDLPPSALRLDYTDAPSGISLIARAFPLLERARLRRPIFQRAETALARLICTIAAVMTGDAAAAARAPGLDLLLSWPEPRIPIPGPERDQSDAWEIGLGVKSRLAVAEERYGLTRAQALEHLKQVADDEREARAILPEPDTTPELEGRGEPEESDDGQDSEPDPDEE
jgi:hypothetical protein